MRQVSDRALDIGRDAPPRIRGRALAASALTALAQGEYERSCTEFELAIPLLEKAGDLQGTAIARAKRGAACMLGGDLERAVVLLDETLALVQAWPEEEPAVVFARFWRAWAAFEVGQLDLAHDLTRTNVRVAREHGLPTTLGHATATLGRIELARNRVDVACALATEALDIELTIADGWGIALALDVFAAAATRRGHHEDAARLLAGVEAHRERIALALRGPTPLTRSTLLHQLRDELGSRFDAFYAEGRALSTEETVRLARGAVAGANGALQASPSAADLPSGGATAGASLDTHAATAVRPRLRVRALGPLEISVDGRVLEPSVWGSARPRELLVYLLVHPEGRTKEQVGLDFWPEASTSQLRNNFHVTLHRLRKALGSADWVSLHGERYRVDPELVTFDVADFEREAATARRSLRRQAEGADEELEHALSHFRGNFMDGEPAGDWHLEHRDHLQRVYLDCLTVLRAHYSRCGQHDQAAETCRRALAHDPLNEEALRALVRALMEVGERPQALRAFQRFRDRLRRELDAEPEKATTALIEQLGGRG
jgi:DNA-binding SARP family transcriptional activator